MSEIQWSRAKVIALKLFETDNLGSDEQSYAS